MIAGSKDRQRRRFGYPLWRTLDRIDVGEDIQFLSPKEDFFLAFTKKQQKFPIYRNPGLSIIELICSLEIILASENAQ